MDLKTNELDVLHGRVGQESNLHLLQDAGFLARKTEEEPPQDTPNTGKAQNIEALQNASMAAVLQVEREYQSRAGYLEDLPVFDEKRAVSDAKPVAQLSWIKARTEDDSQLDCASEVKGFGVTLFGFSILRSLEYKRSRLCDARQFVDATCELADLKGRRLSSASTLQERELAGRSVLNSTKMCIDSMQVAGTELQESMLNEQRKDVQKHLSSEDPRCSKSNEGFVRNMLRCDV